MAGIGATKPVKLIEYVQSQVGDGRLSETPSNEYEMWANVKRKSAGFDYKSGLTNLEETILFTVNYRFTYQPSSTYKIMYLGNIHQVKSVTREDENQFKWIITASAKHS